MRSLLLSFMALSLYRSGALLGARWNASVAALTNRRRVRFIRPELTVKEFFLKLKEREVRYVVLRWFDQLPHVEPGHDIDLLVADEDTERIADLLTYWPIGQPVDVYTVSGAPGYDYAPRFVHGPYRFATAVFPSHLSQRMLDGAMTVNGHFRVPNPRDHFFSLAYHAAYLKGPSSGLRSRAEPDREPATATHDYPTILGQLAGEAGVSLPASPTFEDLDEVLEQAGWRPSRDTVQRLAAWLPWLSSRVWGDDKQAPDGLAVFLIREQAIQDGLKELLIRGLRLRGFETLLISDLDEDESARLAAETRGANWGRGPYPRSGGPPACMVVALDVFPQTAKGERISPGDNHRVHTAKAVLRRWLHRSQPPASRYNPLHSTDNKQEAWTIVRLIAPDEAEAVLERARASIRAFTVRPPGIEELTRYGNRSRVEVIEWRGRRAVRKTFKPHCGNFLQREVEALTALSGSGCVPDILETGESWVVLEYLDDQWHGHVPLFLPLDVVRQLAKFMKFCAAAGYDPIDLIPRSNLILDRDGGLKVLDFEFCARRRNGLAPEELFSLAGVPLDFREDVPFGVDYIHDPYPREWFAYTGLSLDGFLHASPARQRIERAFNRPRIMMSETLLPRLRGELRATRLWRLISRVRRQFGLQREPVQPPQLSPTPGSVSPSLQHGAEPLAKHG